MSNPIDICVNLNGLIPYEKYNYSFRSVGSNWPIVVTPISGTMVSASQSGKIDATVYFCLSKDGCDTCEGLIDNEDCFCNIGEDKFSKLQLSFYAQNDPSFIYNSDTLKVICSGCSPVTKLNIGSHEIKTSGIHKETEQLITANFHNLVPNKTYNYSFESVDSNWPFSLSSISGIFYAHSTTGTISVYGGFCSSSGSCPNNTPGVLSYTIKNNVGIKNWYKTETSLRLLLTDPDCSTIKHYSDIIKIRCLDCVSNGGHVGIGVNVVEGSSC